MSNPAAQARARMQMKWPGATVVRRGRKDILHRHPTEPTKFVLDTGIGPMHYGPSEDQEIDTAWVASQGAWDWEVTKNDFESYVRDSVPIEYRYVDTTTAHEVSLTFNAIDWINDSEQTESGPSFSQVTPAIDDDKIRWSNIATGWSVRVQAQTGRLQKIIEVDSLVNLGTPGLSGTVEWRLDLTFSKSNGLDIYVDDLLWDERGNNPQQTASDIEFRDDTTGETIFWFRRPAAWDSSAEDQVNQAVTTMHLNKQGANLHVEVRIPITWLQTATYPVFIDPTIDPIIGTGNDDANETNTGEVDLTGPQPRLGSGNLNNGYLGHRFVVTGPVSGDTIDVAYQTTYQPNAFADEVDDVDIWCDDVDDSAAWVAGFGGDVSGRTPTSSVVVWDPSPVSIGTGDQDSPSLVGPIGEVIARGGWSSGNHLSTIMGENATATATDWRIHHYEQSTTQAPRLHIEYTAAAGAIMNQLQRANLGADLFNGTLL